MGIIAGLLLAAQLAAAATAGGGQSGPLQQQQQQQQQQQFGAHAIAARKQPRRPDSSSSILAEIEDLNDSSVRTRLGTVTIEHLGDSPSDFDSLIARIVPTETATRFAGHNQQQPQPQSQPRPQQQATATALAPTTSGPAEDQNRVFADANNKTTMRFFRNSKTFASIVYTNPVQDRRRETRRLINCHLVDLEKHSSDVAIYEAKYDIRTTDIEFREMMQLIEACTNIARLRRRPPNGIGQQPGAPGSQYKTSGAQQSALQPASGLLGGPAQGAMRPMLVVGRPLPRPPTRAEAQPQEAAKSGNQRQQQQQQQQQQAVFQQVMSNALNRELSQLPSAGHSDLSSRLELPAAPVVFTEMHNHNGGLNININIGRHSTSSTRRPDHVHHGHSNRPQSQPQKRDLTPTQPPAKRRAASKRNRFAPFKPPQFYVNFVAKRQLAPASLQRNPLVGALAKMGEQSKRLVLGEVTVPPALLAGGANGPKGANASSSLREALQEISSYDTSDLLSIWRGILPGTNWCGMGDRATSYNDLGFESDIDICCRAHDFCPVRLSAFTSGYGLFNWSFYTRSHCWCDQNFLDCLQQAESPLSAVVMKFYFSIMKTTCLNDIETDQQRQPAGKQEPSGAASSSSSPAQQRQQVLATGQAPPQIPALMQSQWLQTIQSERPAPKQ